MSIEDINIEVILEGIIKDLLEEGTSPTLSAILTALDSYSYDLDQPKTTFSDYEVDSGESASALKMNNTMSSIKQDLVVSYNGLFDVANESLKRFERWKTKAVILEGRLNNLIQRIEQLTLLQEDTTGFFNFVRDDFADLSKIDQTNTTARVDVKHSHVSIGTSTTSTTKHHIRSALDSSDVEFTVLSKDSIVSSKSAHMSDKLNAFDSLGNYWQEIVYTNRMVAVNCELKVYFGTTALSISRIDVDLHSASSNSEVQITPLYSTDGRSWNQLSIQNYSLSIRDKATFQFPAVSANYFKFLMRKTAPDITHKLSHCYEFGADEIAFFGETISTSTAGQQLISKPLSIVDPISNTVQYFGKAILETCEQTEVGTNSIDYYITVSNDSTVPIASANWIQLDPLNRDNPSHPIILNFTELDYYTRENVSISIDPTNSIAKYINPKRTFDLLTAMSGTTGTITSCTPSDQRYTFLNEEDKILDLQLLPTIDFDPDSLQIWRNTNTQGDNTLVRGYENGWGFKDDYYLTTVSVDNASGIEIDFGPSPIILDEKSVSGIVSISYGIHTIRVHKDNWLEVDDSAVADLEDLKTDDGSGSPADSLYPYNHRYLVEGFNYPSSYPANEEKVYAGFDIVAEFLMKRTSVMDMLHNISPQDYSRFSIDYDAEDASRYPGGAGISPTKVFLIKVDTSNSDFPGEKFLIRFHPVAVQYQYLRLRAILKTTDSGKSPFLGSYCLRLGGGNNE
jgi:hypothetical protein